MMHVFITECISVRNTKLLFLKTETHYMYLQNIMRHGNVTDYSFTQIILMETFLGRLRVWYLSGFTVMLMCI